MNAARNRGPVKLMYNVADVPSGLPAMPKRLLLPIVLAAGLAAMPGAHAGLFGRGAPAPIAVDAATPATALQGAWKSTGQRVTTPPGNVLISNFRVVVLTNVAGSGSVTPGFANPDGGSASISAFYTLNGLDKAALQAMTDKAYAQLQADLGAAGYTVLPRATLQGVKGVEHLDGDGSLERVQFISAQNGASSGYMFTPSDMPVKLPMGGRKLEEGKPTSDANGKSIGRLFSAAASASGAGRSQFVATEVAGRVGATLLDVTYTVTFAEFKGSGFSNSAGNSATLSSKVTPIIVPTDTSIQVYRPKMGNNGTIELQKPLIAQGQAFADLRETTTRGDKAGAVTGAVLSGLLSMAGGGGTSVHQTKRYEVDATPDHALVLGSALEAANRSIPAAIAQ